MAPRIGITMTPETIEDRAVDALNHAYRDAVVEAGGVPILLPALDARHADLVLDGLDGLLLSGGGDVAPSRYGAAPDPELGEVHEGRDAWEIALAMGARARAVPLLGICRGAQVLNVAYGGTLEQHLPHRSRLAHRRCERSHEAVHEVDVAADSLLATVLGATTLGVNSLHHQAVADVGHGLRAVAWAPDGTVEAVECSGGQAVLAVQWHPELLPAAPHRSLFGWLAARASGRDTVVPILAEADEPDRGTRAVA